MRVLQAAGRPGTPIFPAKWQLPSRAVQRSIMVDTCKIEHPSSGAGTWNATTEQTDPAAPAVVYASGACRLQVLSIGDRTVLAAEQELSIVPYAVYIPWTVTGVKVNDVVTMLTSIDPDAAGLRLTVVIVERQTIIGARRLLCSQES